MRKRVCKMVLAFLLVLTVMGGMVSQKASAEGSAINQVRESVVVVTNYLQELDGSETFFGYGTGFFVGKEGSDVQYLITNHHVIEDYLDKGAGKETAFVSENIETGVKRYFKGKMKIRVFYNAKDYEEAYVVDYDDAKDIALLTLDKPNDMRKPLKLCKPDDSMVGTNIYVIGYPGLSDNHITDAVSNWEIGDASITAGIISRLLTTAGTGVKMIQTDAVVQKGNSGGPMVNESGAVVGVNALGVINTEVQEESDYAVNVSEVITMLKLHDVEYELDSGDDIASDTDDQKTDKDTDSDSAAADQKTDEDTDSDSAVAAADQAASGENSDQQNEAADSQANEAADSQANAAADSQTAESATTEKDGGMAMLPIILIAGAAVLVILIIVVIIISRKKTPSSSNGGEALNVIPPEPQKRIPQNEYARNPMVRSLSSQHNGATYQLNGRQILLGRDMSNCTVIFREGTPGVSNRHCSVAFDEGSGEFIVTDLKSSYGTFLADGQRMKQGVAYRLRSGDQFYLGSNENLIQVEL